MPDMLDSPLPDNVAAVCSRIAPLFDRTFYLTKNADVAAAGKDPLEHFVVTGAGELRDPHPDFSVHDYLADNGEAAAADLNPLLASIEATGSAVQRKRPRRTRRLALSLGPRDARAHGLGDALFQRSGPASPDADPNPLFNVRHYRAQSGLRLPAAGLLEHYLIEGWRRGLSPHALFDPAHYERQVGGSLGEPHLVHYLAEGWRRGLSPHIAFDPEHYAERAGISAGTCPLVHYLLAATPDAQPNCLFEDSRLLARMAVAGVSPGATELEAYLALPALWPEWTHALFEPAHFYSELALAASRGGSAASGSATRAAEAPLVEYLRLRPETNVSPSPLFWARFYRAQAEKAGFPEGSLREYLRFGFRTLSPHPAMDPAYYETADASFDPKRETIVDHLIRTPEDKRRSPSPHFDREFYLRTNEDVAAAGACPILHFCRTGLAEGRAPNGWHNPNYAARRAADWKFGSGTLGDWLCLQTLEPRPALLFASHDASRTGAPKIVLRLMQDFQALGLFDIYCLLDKPGELLPEFEATSFSYVLKNSVYEIGANSPTHRVELRPLIEALDGRIAGAVCNSIETRHIAELLSEHGVQIVSLIHEIPDYYAPSDFMRVFKVSKEVVFPSRFVLERASRTVQLPETGVHVFGQGLLDPAFGRQDRAASRRLAEAEFGVEPDAVIIAACGTVDLRKGMDYFVATAREVFERGADDGGPPVYFFWFGKADGRPATPFGFIREELARLGLDDRIRFVGEREEMPVYLAMADIFLLPSRADPFPCVAHEAMAAGLPLVCFREGGGACELVGGDGVAVPLGDVSRAASAVLALIDDPVRRTTMGRRAAARIEAEWTSRSYAARIADLGAQAFGVAGPALADAVSLLRQPAPAAPPGRCPIYFLAPDWSPSGVNMLTDSLVRELCVLGWDAKIVFTRGRFTPLNHGESGAPITPDAPFEVIHPQTGDTQGLRQAFAAFLAASPLAIVVPNRDYVSSALAPTFPEHIRIVGVAHGDDAEHYEHAYRLGRYWDRIVAASQRIGEQIVAMNPAFDSRLEIVRIGVQPVSQHIQVRASDPGQPIRLTYAGRMVRPQKRVQRYIELAKELDRRGVPYELIMIGDGDELPALKRAAQALPQVTFKGRMTRRDTLDAIAASDVFVLLSDFEGTPVSLIEALAVGCAPVTFPIESGVPDLVRNGHNGFIAANRSISEVADIISRLASDRTLLSRLRMAAVKTVGALGLTVAETAKAYSSLFETVLAERFASPPRQAAPSGSRKKPGSLPTGPSLKSRAD